MAEIVHEYRINVDKTVADLRRVADATEKTEAQFRKTAQAANDSFLKGSDGAKRFEAELKRTPKTLAEMELKLRNLRELLRDDTNIGTEGFKRVRAEIDKTQKQIDGLNGNLKKTGINFANIGRQILTAFGAVGAVFTFVNALKNAVQVSANFEKQMSTVRAISGATTEEMDRLEKSARALGASTRYTATQVGTLQEEFGRLGFSTEEILAATEATLNLATATGSTLAESAEVAGATVRAFQLDASETVRVTDVMALSFSKSALNMERFRESIKLVAPIAKAANIPLETTTALLGQLADAGLSGSIAGTSLKNLLSKLSDENSELSKSLGMSVKNSDDLFEAFRRLKDANIDLTEATELTDERSKAAFITLIAGVDRVKALDTALQGATGSTQRMADIMDDNLKGAVTRLSSAWEGLMLKMSEGSTGLMSEFIRSLTTEVDRLNESVGKLKGSGEDFSVVGFIMGNIAKALGEPFRVANNIIERFANTYDYLARKVDRANYQFSLHGEELERWNKMSTEAQDRLVRWSKAVSDGTDIHNDAIGPLERFIDTIAGSASEPVKANIRNIYFLTKAIKDLKDEAEKEGTSRERIREIMRQIIPLETELAELLGKETDAMKKLREETEKATKAEEDRLAALDKASDDKLKKRLAVDAFIAERTAMGLKEEMEAAILAEQQKAMLMEADALNAGLSQDKIEAIRQASVDEQLRIQNEYGAKIQEVEDAGVQAVKDSEEEKQKIREKAFEKFRNEFQQFTDLSTQAIDLISQAQQAATDNELAMLAASLEAGQITREEYDQKRKELLQEQAEENKALALAQATINGALAAINAYAEGGPIAAAIAAIFAAAQIAIIAAQPIPQFEQGGRIGGKRHAQGGTLIEAEEGEFVINRRSTSKNYELIDAINKGVEDAYIMRHWVAPAVDSALLNGWQDVGKSAELNNITAKLSDHNIIAAMDRNRSATVYGLKMLAEKIDKRPPKRGGYA